jgi:hypothetical protein
MTCPLHMHLLLCACGSKVKPHRGSVVDRKKRRRVTLSCPACGFDLESASVEMIVRRWNSEQRKRTKAKHK